MLIFAVPAFFLGRVIWPDPMGGIMPTAAQLPFYVILAVAESLTFGFGIAFLIQTWPKLGRVPVEQRRLTAAAILAITWLLVNWWPHDNLHRANGMNTQGLLYIEYGFHITLMLAGIVLIYFLFDSVRSFTDN